MSNKVTVTAGVAKIEETGLLTDALNGAIGITKVFDKSDVYYNGTTVAIAQGVGVVAGLFVAAKMPSLNFFE